MKTRSLRRRRNLHYLKTAASVLLILFMRLSEIFNNSHDHLHHLKQYSCIKFVVWSYFKPFKSMFKSWDSCAVRTWLLTEPWTVCMALHGTALQPRLIIWSILLFSTLGASMTLWRCNDVQNFDTDAILLRKIQCKKWDILMFKRRFQWRFGWKLGKICKNNDHTCLFHYINTCQVPNVLMFKQRPLG